MVVVVLFESTIPLDQEQHLVGYIPKDPFLHLFDPEMVPAIGPLWWCMHLPRGPGDLSSVSPTEFRDWSHLELPHQIYLMPAHFVEQRLGEMVAPDEVLAIVAPRSALSIAEECAAKWSPILGVLDFDRLDQATLEFAWSTLAGLAKRKRDILEFPQIVPLDALGAERLSVTHFGQQLGLKNQEFAEANNLSQSDAIAAHLYNCRVARALASLEEEQIQPEAAKEHFDEKLKQTLPQLNVVISAAGVPAAAKKLARLDGNLPPPGVLTAPIAEERKVIDLMVAHRAIARTGFGMRVSDVSPAAFELLRNLENAASAVQPKVRKIKSMLSRLGAELTRDLTTDQQRVIRSSRSITAFTDFPWGLGILPGDSSPICTAVPVCYRPLSPLSRALQFELAPPPRVFLGDKLHVAIIEGLSESDPIRQPAERLWNDQRDYLDLHGSGKVSCEYVVVAGVRQMESVLAKRQADLLIVSGHGISNGRMAGMRIGHDDVYDFPFAVPPVVMFSACAVWPRGGGQISLADLALRRGALAVLGTLMPVRLRHNAYVVRRLLLYMVESMLGREPEATLADVAHRALSSNAVVDLLTASPAIERWALSSRSGQSSPLEEFMLRHSRGRLRPGHIYSDTEAILSEIAQARGADAVNALSGAIQNGYIQESLYYTMIGWPESVVFQPRFEAEASVRESMAKSSG